MVDEKVMGEITNPDVYGYNYGEVWKGYFVPTVTGGHVFRGMADDDFYVYLSNGTYGSVVNMPVNNPTIYTAQPMRVSSYFFDFYST